VRRPLPGDGLVTDPRGRTTRAISIRASAAEVWPWLVQIGQGRGGFYSFTWLENLAGCHITNAERTVPEWQGVKVGDPIALHPKAPRCPWSPSNRIGLWSSAAVRRHKRSSQRTCGPAR
jgi:hypothetical protein